MIFKKQNYIIKSTVGCSAKYCTKETDLDIRQFFEWHINQKQTNKHITDKIIFGIIQQRLFSFLHCIGDNFSHQFPLLLTFFPVLFFFSFPQQYTYSERICSSSSLIQNSGLTWSKVEQIVQQSNLVFTP